MSGVGEGGRRGGNLEEVQIIFDSLIILLFCLTQREFDIKRLSDGSV